MDEIEVNIGVLWYVGISIHMENRNDVIIISESGRILSGFGGYKWATNMGLKSVSVVVRSDDSQMSLPQITDMIKRNRIV
jgi:hypothetical protein